MKKFNPILFALFLLIGFTACMKDQEVYDVQEHLDLEAPIIASYVESDSVLSVNAQPHETGIWYVIENEGVGDYTYENWPYITVKYSGKLLNGTEFDSSDSTTFYLGDMITAWKIAFLPETLNGENVGIALNGLQKGAKIRFVTPSPWAYGSSPNASIPVDSPLDFTIEVLNVEEPTQL